MSSGFITCPNCESVVLPDTAVCPSCSHVLDATRAHDVVETRRSQQDASSESFPVPSDDDREQACSSCGEMVRVGLVRCWNCGEFMREDIAQTYEQMQSQPRPVIYSPLPDLDDSPEPQSDQHSDTYRLHSEGADDDSDFELNEANDDDDFDLSPNVGIRDDMATSDKAAETPADAASPPEGPDRPAGEAGDDASAPADSSASKTPKAATDEAAEGDTARTGETGEAADENVAHSVATGGDALLEIAMQEEKQSGRKQRRGLARGGFLVYCPNGHRIEVQDRHRGRTGRCPKCRAAYTVPLLHESEGKEQAEPEAERPRPSQQGVWITDIRLHTVDPTKLKLKPGSLASAFETFDVWCRENDIQILRLAKPGLFGAPDKKTLAAARETLMERIDEETPLSDLPVVDRIEIKADQVGELKVAQPAPYAHESLFAGIPVFGEGRIVVRLPVSENDKTHRYLSFAITSFRKFSQALASQFEVDAFGAESGVPLDDEVRNVACHYSEQLLKPLSDVQYYEADDDVELELIGWECEGCGLVVSEPARKKEKIGGASGRGIAKAKCPKCKQKFGNHPLYVLKVTEPEATEESTSDSEMAETAQSR